MIENDAWLSLASDAHFLNAIANHPSIRDSVAGSIEGELDLSPLLSDRRTTCLVGAHGWVVFREQWPYIWDMHAAALPRGRGKWALGFGKAALCWLFDNKVACCAVIASIPEPNRPARLLANMLGFRLVCVSPAAWPMPAGVVPLYSYVLRRTECKWMEKCQ
jgi:hypothetical protein